MKSVLHLKLSIVLCFLIGCFVGAEIFSNPVEQINMMPFLSTDSCTTIAVGRLATIDGSAMTTHSNDCDDCDPRLSKIPAKSDDSTTTSYVYLEHATYPRYLGYKRGNTYLPNNIDYSIYNWSLSIPMGSIPGVENTFGYLEGNYAIINEKQLAMGESTCGAKFIGIPVAHGGSALFSIRGLTVIAMERCETAVCAIDLMGALGVRYGFYGEVWEGPGRFDEAGEALSVSDTKETWIFHIMPDDTGASAVWAAQRVPDDHLSVVANQFIIRNIDLSSPNFRASENVFDVAKRTGLWNPDIDGEFDFTKAYAVVKGAKTYSTRRIWRVLSWAAPDLNLSPESDDLGSKYPFSVKPSRLLSVQDLMNIQRDHYEGTEFDLTQNPAGGPYGDPNRFDSTVPKDLTIDDLLKGKFERSISIHRTSYAFVTQSRKNFPDIIGGLVWFASYAPHASYFVPLYSNINDIPKAYQVGSLHKFEQNSAFWVSVVLGNYAARFYLPTIGDIKSVQAKNEELMFVKQEEIESKALTLLHNENEDSARNFLTEYSAEESARMHTEWWNLFGYIVTKYHDGFIFNDLKSEDLVPIRLFYPLWWLNMVGYFPDNLAAEETLTNQYLSAQFTVAIVCGTCFIGVFFGVLISRYLFKKYAKHLP